MFQAVVMSACLEDTLNTFHKLNIPMIQTVPYFIINTECFQKLLPQLG